MVFLFCGRGPLCVYLKSFFFGKKMNIFLGSDWKHNQNVALCVSDLDCNFTILYLVKGVCKQS